MDVIIVDDEPGALADLERVAGDVLPEAGLHAFLDPHAALRYAVAAPIDVAFLDIEMDSMNGIELAKRLKDARSTTDVVFTTGYPEHALEAFSVCASDFLVKPVTAESVRRALGNLRHPHARPSTARVRVRTFGNFDVFVDGAPLRFPRSKSKELFAYLVHKRGTGCSTREIAAVLYGDRPYSISVQKQMQTALSCMMRTLRDAGVDDCVERRRNWTAVVVSKIDCDYYRFLKGEPEAVNDYTGEYLANYEWADFVVGYLDGRVG